MNKIQLMDKYIQPIQNKTNKKSTLNKEKQVKTEYKTKKSTKIQVIFQS